MIVVWWPPQPASPNNRSMSDNTAGATTLRFFRRAAIPTMPIKPRPNPMPGSHVA